MDDVPAQARHGSNPVRSQAKLAALSLSCKNSLAATQRQLDLAMEAKKITNKARCTKMYPDLVPTRNGGSCHAYLARESKQAPKNYYFLVALWIAFDCPPRPQASIRGYLQVASALPDTQLNPPSNRKLHQLLVVTDETQIDHLSPSVLSR
jgi:hypothetical protein